MPRIARYLTHPEVQIDSLIDIRHWSLNAKGRARVAALAASDALRGTRHVISSDEVKATDTARPLAKALGADLWIRPALHENDRSATGFLPPDEFERTADRFFAHPDESVRGWETARAAQARVVGEVHRLLSQIPVGDDAGDVLFVGHGGVGTLLYCALAGLPIDRRHDQLAGGGCVFAFDFPDGLPHGPWAPMEGLIP